MFTGGDKVLVPKDGWVLGDLGDYPEERATFAHYSTDSAYGRARGVVVDRTNRARYVWVDRITPEEETTPTPNNDKDNNDMTAFLVDNFVSIRPEFAGMFHISGGGRMRLDPTHRLRITRVGRENILVRREDMGSTWLPKAHLTEYESPEQKAEKQKAKLEASKGPDAIAADDPRIAWIWKEAARLADEAGHCSEYDELAAALGVPGREGEYTVEVNFGGDDPVLAWFTVRAENEEAAFDKVRVIVHNATYKVED